MADALAHGLRLMAKRGLTPMEPDTIQGWFGYLTHGHIAVGSRIYTHEWYFATNDERRMFMLLVAEDLETFWS